MGKILVVGSIAYDSVTTPSGHVEEALGGSANYFSMAASLFTPVRIVGVVGEDYRQDSWAVFKNRDVDTRGIIKSQGKTFRWEGEYLTSLDDAKTIRTDLNVFETFHPEIPREYQDSEYLFLANIDPDLQLEVLSKMKNKKFVAADTMNFWIHSKPESLKKVLEMVDLFFVNEKEANLISGKNNAIAAAPVIASMGPRAVMIKRGEYGFVLFTDGQFSVFPAVPVPDVVDPTGAGDSFAGGVIGYLAQRNLGFRRENLIQAGLYGAVLASFTVQDFSVNRLKDLTLDQIDRQWDQFKGVFAL